MLSFNRMPSLCIRCLCRSFQGRRAVNKKSTTQWVRQSALWWPRFKRFYDSDEYPFALECLQIYLGLRHREGHDIDVKVGGLISCLAGRSVE